MTACHCKTCNIITKHRPHRPVAKPTWFVCEVCGTERWYAKAFGAGDFPELTHDENEIIHEARALGFGYSFAAFPDATAQAQNTLKAAKLFLDAKGCPQISGNDIADEIEAANQAERKAEGRRFVEGRYVD